MQFDIRLSGYYGGAPVVLLAGWPDTSSVFASSIDPIFLDTSKHFLISLSLPNYQQHLRTSRGGSSGGAAPSVFHATFDDICIAFGNAIQQAMTSHTAGSSPSSKAKVPKPILICHDWGCVVAFEFLQRNPFYFDRIVALDIGGHVLGDTPSVAAPCNLGKFLLGSHAAAPLNKSLWMLFYQCCIMALYLVRYLPVVGGVVRPVADWLAGKVTGVLGKRPVYKDAITGLPVAARADMGYMYFLLWKGLIPRLPILTLRFPLPVNVPVLYLYGRDKLFHFHTDKWLKIVEDQRQVDGISKTEGVAGGHWFFCETAAGKAKTVELVTAFVAAKPKTAA